MSQTPASPPGRPGDTSHGAASVVLPGSTLVMLNQLGSGLFPVGAFDPPGWLFLTLAVGLIAPMLYWTGYRVIGVVPVCLSLVLACGTAALVLGPFPFWVGDLMLLTSGLTVGSIFRFQGRGFWQMLTRPQTVTGLAVISWFDSLTHRVLTAAVFIQLTLTVFISRSAPPAWWGWACTYCFFAYGIALTAFAWYRLFRPFFELCVEPVLWVGYCIRGQGPGLAVVPYNGPLLVIANHACWWDPLFLAKVLPRPVTPMMTARFFDVWFLRPLMVHTFRVIRVPEATVRREAPEIREAVAALEAGECVVIFPEGYLRRKTDQPLRRFGRGVWEILKARPDTPVLACWIEGAWGSWSSYAGGKPTENKKPDFRRPIRVGVSEPVTVKPELLENHLRTRLALMNMVSGARAHLGLPPLPTAELPVKDEAVEATADV